MKRNLLLTICSFLFLGQSLFAQTTGGASSGKYGLPSPKDYDKWSMGISFGQTLFLGDVLKDSKNNEAFKKLPFAPNFGLQVTRQLSHSIGLRASGSYAMFKAGPSKEKYDNQLPSAVINYESPVYEGVLDGVYTFGNISHLKRNKKFHFYVSLGIGFFNFDGELRDDSTDVLLKKTGSVTELMLPVSLGFKYQIKKFDIGLSYDFRKTFTDKVDGIRKELSEYDNYSFIRLNVNYSFGKKNKSMEWINPMEVVYNDIADLKDKVDILSGDKDKDGVSDMFDKDNATAEGTKVYGDGTSIDTDGDGISDSKDGDPFSLKGAKVDANGVEIDTDGDGVADSRDLEPNTEKGKLVNFQGMTIEMDPSKGASTSVSFLPSVFFDTNSSTVKQVFKDRILVVARALKTNPDLKIMISGNTDVTAAEPFNEKLGLKRAEAVKNHLVKVYGIDAARLSTETKGEKEPLADKANNPMNRRVDFSVVK
ncbi:MAG: OmpA family protein [Bacteroidetes bacterium]|nr:OmpA family protein [Bacteroidota bacterium]